MTTIQSHSSFRKWSVNSEHLQAVSVRLGVPSSWPEDPYASGGSKVRSSDGHSSGDPLIEFDQCRVFCDCCRAGETVCVDSYRLFSIVNRFTFAEVVSSLPNSEV